MTLQEWLILIYWWERQYSSKDASEVAEVDKKTACDVYRWLKKVYSTTLLAIPIVLGGPGVVCQIDEFFFIKHKPKVHVKSCTLYIYVYLHYVMVIILLEFILKQYHQGHAAHSELWVFGVCDTSHTLVLGFMKVVALKGCSNSSPNSAETHCTRHHNLE